MTTGLLKDLRQDAGEGVGEGALAVRDYPSFSFLRSLSECWAHVFLFLTYLFAWNRAVSLISADLFHKPVFMPKKEGKISLFTVYRQRARQREGEVRWCQRWDFADSIFTHQTELFPVSTWPNSRSHHLRLLLSVYSLLLLYLSLPPGCLSVRLPFIVVNFHGICFPSPAHVVCLYFPRRLSQVLTPSLLTASPSSFSSLHFLTLLSLSLSMPPILKTLDTE